ncbi:hypothetical protein [Hymenobacter nivis]|uniref:hypothetical protein n=1 Tax=Hymenobacter nivis TaxID=1850093 RepID=UPI0011298AD2|nr:hypothetical protein [Hymenobacter nivis]
MPTTRAAHLEWAKARALEYVDAGELANACASFMSDLTKHPEIDPTAAGMVYAMEAFSGGLNTPDKVRHFINGTN